MYKNKMHRFIILIAVLLIIIGSIAALYIIDGGSIINSNRIKNSKYTHIKLADKMIDQKININNLRKNQYNEDTKIMQSIPDYGYINTHLIDITKICIVNLQNTTIDQIEFIKKEKIEYFNQELSMLYIWKLTNNKKYYYDNLIIKYNH